jgi:hypothetical protein
MHAPSSPDEVEARITPSSFSADASLHNGGLSAFFHHLFQADHITLVPTSLSFTNMNI